MHPVLFEWEALRLHSYGVLIAAGGVLSAWFWLSRHKAMGVASRDDVWLLVNAILISGFLGGRLLYLFEYTRPFGPEFWRAAFAFDSGFSVLGAFASVAAGVWWFARRARAPFLRILDYVCMAAPVWHALGRLGCFLAGCCHGRPADLPWAVRFTDPRAQVPSALLGVPLHPAQLYEAAGDLVIAAGLYFLALRPLEAGRLKPGALSAAYFAAYALLRFATEFVRGDGVALPWAPFTAGQLIAAGLLAGAGALAVFVRRSPCTRS